MTAPHLAGPSLAPTLPARGGAPGWRGRGSLGRGRPALGRGVRGRWASLVSAGEIRLGEGGLKSLKKVGSGGQVVGAARANGVGRSCWAGVVGGLAENETPSQANESILMKTWSDLISPPLSLSFQFGHLSLVFSVSDDPKLNSKTSTWGNLVGEIKESNNICL